MKPLRSNKRRAPGGVSESTLVTAILKALKLKGVFCWRSNSGLTVLPAQGGHARRVVKGAEAGTPDILVVLPRPFDLHINNALGTETVKCFAQGTLCGLEIKTATGNQRPSQKAWQVKAAAHGVRYGIARSVSEALRLVEVWSGRKVER